MGRQALEEDSISLCRGIKESLKCGLGGVVGATVSTVRSNAAALLVRVPRLCLPHTAA